MKHMRTDKLHLLIIEDNAALAGNLFDYFEARGHRLEAAPDGLSGLHLASSHDYDAIVLDWMLPRLDGVGFLRRLRSDALCDTPVLMLTSKDQLLDKMTGFQAGADDYLVKPFALPELELRLQALVARARRAMVPARALQVADLRFDLRMAQASRNGRVLMLSPAGRCLLELLMRAAPKVVTRQAMEYALWGEDAPDLDLLRSHMHLLRKAVDGPFACKLIHTVPRHGYRMDGGDGDAQGD